MQDIKALFNYLLSVSEWEGYVEFKENFDKLRDGKNISAISNISLLKWKEFGYIIYGVRDKTKEIVGTTFKPNDHKVGNQNIKLWLSQKITPKTLIEFHEIEIEEKHIVIVRFSAAHGKPTKFDGHAYIRIGESTTNLDNHPELEQKIWNNERNKNFEKGIAKQDLSLDEVLKLLDYDKYFQLTKQDLPTETNKFLEKLAQDKLVLIQNDGNYSITVLWAILFARDIHQFDIIKRKSVRIITYNGKTRQKRKHDFEARKWYALWFEWIVDYVISQAGSNEVITKALRIDNKLYPEITLREFTANAIIHQDFSVSWAWPIIEIFSNRIEITNPWVPLIDVERFIDHPPRSRNEDLASIMRRFWFCEESWSGVDRALIHIELYQLPAPKFETYEDFTKVTMYAPKALKSMSQEDRIRACYQHCVLVYLKWEEKMQNKTLRERLNIPESNYPAASKIIADTIEKWKIKQGERPKEYIPRRA